MQLGHRSADFFKGVKRRLEANQSKRPTMGPKIVFLFKNLSQEIEIVAIFESLEQFDTGKPLTPVRVSQFYKTVFFEDNISLTSQTLNLLKLADFEGKKHVWKCFMSDLKYLGEIALAKLFDYLKII
jgi:hypothetical protein